jgi:hypothetical protein
VGSHISHSWGCALGGAYLRARLARLIRRGTWLAWCNGVLNQGHSSTSTQIACSGVISSSSSHAYLQ